MKLVHTGITRHVILVGDLAIKVPRVNHGWINFLNGLLCNMQETVFGRSKLDGFCPVIFAIPGGWLVAMKRVRVMTEQEFDVFDVEAFCHRPDYSIRAECKADSFGWLNGSPVAIDYGERV